MADLGPIVSARILGEVGQDVVGIVESARQRLIKDIERGIADGLGAAQLADLIEQSSAFGSYRSEVIARTETNRALNLAQVERYKEFGVKLVKVYDGDDDEECRERQSRDNGWGPGIYTVEEAANIRDHPNGTMDWSPIVLTQEPNPTPPEPSQAQRELDIPTELSEGDMVSHLRRMFPDADEFIDLDVMPPTVRSEVVRVLDRLTRKYPRVQATGVQTRLRNMSNTMAAVQPNIRDIPGQGPVRQKLIFSGHRFSSVKKLANDAAAMKKSGHSAYESVADKMSFIEYTTTHEFGHMVENSMFKGRVSRIADITAAPNTKYGRTNYHEGWAEGFAQYEAGIDTAAARIVAEELAKVGA